MSLTLDPRAGAPAGVVRNASPTPRGAAGRSTVYAPRGVTATSHPLASSAGLEMLLEGGNAVDAAVAAAAVLNVVEPHMTGMGGDMFAILWSAAERRLVGLDASGCAGSGMTVAALRGAGHETVPLRGAGAVTVPGAVSGWAALVERYGSLPLARVLEPAVRLAEEGFPVSPIIAGQWGAAAEKLEADEGARAIYLPGGRAPTAGERFSNPDLAAALRLVGSRGAQALYGGELGRRLVAGLRERGGFLSEEDLERHRVRWVDPISVDFRGHTVWELPPAGQGIAALQMLRILEPLDLAALGHNSAAYLHQLVEAKKLAFADLAGHIADARFMEASPAALLDPAYLAGRRALIDPERAAERPDPGRPATESDTIYLAAADRDGNMVSFINSIYESFGSGVVIPGTGFALQNRGAGFTLEDGHPNQVAPGKRPFHTIIPGFLTRGGEPQMAFGVMGAAMQPQGHVQLLLNLLVFGMDPQEAVDAARFRHLDGRKLALEPVGPEVVAELTRLGHEVESAPPAAFGGAQVVLRLESGWAAASDPRKDGQAVGY